MAVKDFKAEGLLLMVLEVLSPDGNCFNLRAISTTFRGKRISIVYGKIAAIRLNKKARDG